MERAMGVEPTSLAWEAKVMAVIRRPLGVDSRDGRGLTQVSWTIPADFPQLG
ncbi:hypothetical protein CCP4SC76_2840002 [Gammaproteobacteria bacterium]